MILYWVCAYSLPSQYDSAPRSMTPRVLSPSGCSTCTLISISDAASYILRCDFV